MKRRITGPNVVFSALLAAASLIALAATLDASAAEPKKKSPVGAWFGIARPCPPPSQDTSPLHAAFCTAVCATCSGVPGTLPPEMTLLTTIAADGTLRADDGGELSVFHTSAHGSWAPSVGDGLPDRAGTSRSKGTFLWLGQNFFGSNKLDNAIRTRFVTYFDPLTPDQMLGYIQPHFFHPITPFSTNGIVNVVPSEPTDEFASDHLPSVDPIQTLAAGCVLPPAGSCLGTYHFVIRRIKTQ